MFVSKTHHMHICARMHDRGQILGLITCSEHKKNYEPHNQRTWQESQVSSLGQIRKIHARSMPKPSRSPSLHCCSKGQVDQVVPLQMMTKPEAMSTQLARKKKKPPDTIFPDVAGSGSFHTSCTDLSRCSLSCLCCRCRRASNLNLRVRICTCPHEGKCPLRDYYRGSSRCTNLCDHLWHPFPFQPCCR